MIRSFILRLAIYYLYDIFSDQLFINYCISCLLTNGPYIHQILPLAISVYDHHIQPLVVLLQNKT